MGHDAIGGHVRPCVHGKAPRVLVLLTAVSLLMWAGLAIGLSVMLGIGNTP